MNWKLVGEVVLGIVAAVAAAGLIVKFTRKSNKVVQKGNTVIGGQIAGRDIKSDK